MPLPAVPVTAQGFLRAGQILEVTGNPDKNIPRAFAVAHIDKDDKRSAYLCFTMQEVTAKDAAELEAQGEVIIFTSKKYDLTGNFADQAKGSSQEKPYLVNFEKPVVIIDRAGEKTAYTIHAGKDLSPENEGLLRGAMNEIITSDAETVAEYKARFTQIGTSEGFSGVSFGPDAHRRTNVTGHIQKSADGTTNDADGMDMEP